MLEVYLRPLYQLYFVNPIAAWSNKLPPARITGWACLTGILVAPSLILGLPGVATMLLLMSGFLDTLDGTVARLRKKESDIGTVIDIVSDRIVEFAVILGLFAIDPVNRGLVTLVMLGSCYVCITCFLVVGIFVPNRTYKGFHYSPGLVERAETFIFFLLMIWLPEYFPLLATLFTIAVLLTSYHHIKQIMKNRKSASFTNTL